MSRQGDKARAAWLDRYRAALVQACGAAEILGYDTDTKTLLGMIHAARVDRPAEKCYNNTKSASAGAKTEVNAMKIYWAETNANNGILLIHNRQWYYKFGGQIDGLTVCAENAAQIAANIRDGWKNGGFDAYDFADWCDWAQMNSNPSQYAASGHGTAAGILSEFEKYNEL